MNKVLAVVATTITVSAGWSQTAAGQEAANKAVPVEFFSCNFQEGKNMKDLGKVIEKFRAWSDKNDTGYSAWTLTPQFSSAELTFDIGWMGSWPDAVAFGKGMDAWMSGGGDLAEEFNDVIDCSAHELASAVAINAPDGPSENGIVIFSGCTLQEGKSHRDAFEAHMKLGASMRESGSKASSWLFYPGMGSAVDYDYWRVVGFKSYSDLGEGLEAYTNGGGWERIAKAIDPVASCGASAAFDARLVRMGGRQ